MIHKDTTLSTLPYGVIYKELTMHQDDRGSFTEVFREEWDTGINPIQWNVVSSQAGVLRGVHAHIRHDDYLIILEGHALVGLQDLRKGSPTENSAVVVEMHGEKLASLTIPHGVAHGFYFCTSSKHLYSVSEYWNLNDELRCNWMDPDLHIPWPFQTAYLGIHDANAESFKKMADKIKPWQPD